MTGEERRKKIIAMLTKNHAPVSGQLLAEKFHVSRQVIVQDIALLRTSGYEVFSTNKGYLLHERLGKSRVFKVVHTNEECEEELQMIIDLGGIVADEFVYHKVYDVLRAELNIKSRRDIQTYINDLKSGKSSSLLNITSGYHYHTVYADDVQTLDEIQEALTKRGFLAKLKDYEPVDFWTE